jgi:hypothetical protein
MSRVVCSILLTCALAPSSAAQVFVNSPGNLPFGSGNNGATMQVDFADVDLDGDVDVACADGGQIGNAQSRLWINLGGLQGGTQGLFVDETAARLPAVLDQTRDVDFADYDGDGDPDLYCVNVSNLTNQPSRFWTNMGGLQGGTSGFFSDQTAARWVGLGGPGSSIWPSLVLAGGGFASWPEDQAFADVDGDGDLDLVASALGQGFNGFEPTRVFLNDGAGFFSEFNPSGFQLASAGIANGNPGLWCEGTQASNTPDSSGASCDIAGRILDVDVVDLDSDLDLDFIQMKQTAGATRAFRNRSETGTLAFRDVSSATFPSGTGSGQRYEMDLGDLDGDADIDIYGVNWATGSFADGTLTGTALGVFGAPVQVPSTAFDTDAGELVDYDDDGRIDMFLGRYIQADRLMRNVSAGTIAFQYIPGGVFEGTPILCWDADVADVDGDGRDDILKAHEGANRLLLNTGGQADTHAPRVVRLEQPADQDTQGQPIAIRAQVYDNASELVTARNATTLYYQVDAGATQTVPMRWMGGQIVHAELPGSAYGHVKYFAVSQDSAGNQGSSPLKSIHTAGGCSGQAITYCTGLVNSGGCAPGITFNNAPSASAGSGFELRVVGLVPNSVGLFFYSKTGSASTPFAGGLLCVAPPLLRTPGQGFGGSGPCGGQMVFDFNAYIASGVDPALLADTEVFIQAWARDAAAPSTISLSNGLHFTICD